LTARYLGETHVYQYAPDEREQAMEIIRSHAADGRLHPYAALMLVRLGESDDV
jgi:hypothetical protein